MVKMSHRFEKYLTLSLYANLNYKLLCTLLHSASLDHLLSGMSTFFSSDFDGPTSMISTVVDDVELVDVAFWFILLVLICCDAGVGGITAETVEDCVVLILVDDTDVEGRDSEFFIS